MTANTLQPSVGTATGMIPQPMAPNPFPVRPAASFLNRCKDRAAIPAGWSHHWPRSTRTAVPMSAGFGVGWRGEGLNASSWLRGGLSGLLQ